MEGSWGSFGQLPFSDSRDEIFTRDKERWRKRDCVFISIIYSIIDKGTIDKMSRDPAILNKPILYINALRDMLRKNESQK